MKYIYPLRLEATFHETIWGGRGLERDRWKQLPAGKVTIGEAWETEVGNLVQNGPYVGKTLDNLVDILGIDFLGDKAITTFGHRFPLLAKFIDANAQLSVQVHPEDHYAAWREGGKLGKTEYWYILAAEPGATVVHGFKTHTSREEVQEAIAQGVLDRLLHEEVVYPGDIIFVPAGTVHAIGKGIVLYELQEYSDITYRMYDYGRLTASGKPRELHIERSLDVATYERSRQVKTRAVPLQDTPDYAERCIMACRYFLTREILLKQRQSRPGRMTGQTDGSCVILTSLGAEAQVHFGASFEYSELLTQGQTIVLPASLGDYQLEGQGRLLLSYVPTHGDEAWAAWNLKNKEYKTASRVARV